MAREPWPSWFMARWLASHLWLSSLPPAKEVASATPEGEGEEKIWCVVLIVAVEMVLWVEI